MKICAIICEYNPFHNGHLYQLQQAKALSRADAIICIMSGNFVQRGENAITDKYTRARHACLAGADVVLELPVPFATSNAELFAQGAIRILSSIPEVTTLCFGAENADKTAFLLGARYANAEPESVSKSIQEQLAQGVSYAKARTNAFAGFIPYDLLSSPNNILGLEYTKAILSQNSHLEILPIQRTGCQYADMKINGSFASATAIRTALQNGEAIENCVPSFVANDLPIPKHNCLDTIEKYAVLTRTPQEISSVCDCTEGLENAFKKAALSSATLVESLTSSRYTASRIRRIALQNALQIDEDLVRGILREGAYIKPLAVRKDSEDVLSALGKSSFPLIVRATDNQLLTGYAKRCFEKERFADEVYTLLHPYVKPKNIRI